MLTRAFALACGIVFVLAGLFGFLPLTTGAPPADAPHLHLAAAYGYLLGLFPVNIVHNLVHLTIGILGFAASRSQPGARVFARGLAIGLGLLTVMGLIPALSTTFGLVPLFGHAVWLHGVEALAAAYVGFLAQVEPATTAAARRVETWS